MKNSFRNLFEPKSVALVGVSRNPDHLGFAIMRNLIIGGYTGVVYPVNPRAKAIMGVHTYPSLSDIPEPVDLAVVAVPRDYALPVVEECARLGIKSLVVVTAGFKEIGEEGKKIEDRIAEIARTNGMALIGPNCLGVINTDSHIRLNTTFAEEDPRPGNVSFLSQSGALGVHALEFTKINDIGFNKFVSIGNKAVLNENDILRVFGEDESSKVILAYLESIEDPRAFFKTAADITLGKNGKPLVVIKSGRGQGGKRAAASHTGALAERDDILDFLFEQCGIIRVETMWDLFNFGICLANQPLPLGKRMAILTNAGGPGIIATDEAEKKGLTVPELSAELQEKLLSKMPPVVSVKNPIDMVGDADEHRFEFALRTVLESDEVDVVLVLCTPRRSLDMAAVAHAVASCSELARSRQKTLVTSFVGFDRSMQKVFKIFDEADIPNYRFGENAVRSAAAAVQYARYRSWRKDDMPELTVDSQMVRKVLDEARQQGRNFLTEPESYRIFKAYGFKVAAAAFARNMEDAVVEAAALRYPLVAKIVSPDVIHKFDFGGVILNITDEQDLRLRFGELVNRVKKNKPDVRIEGVLLQEMITDGIELIIGSNYSEHYGHLVMFGLGGTFVEVLKDVTFRKVPIGPSEAERMIREIKSSQMLNGFRGMAPRDIPAIAECICRLSQLLNDFPEIREIDLNPVFALEKGVKVADARILI